MKVAGCGGRVHRALTLWWDKATGLSGSQAHHDIGPGWRALLEAEYDPKTDTISWRGQQKTIAQIYVEFS